MRKGTFIAICAFLVALVGVMIALAAYLKRDGAGQQDLDDDIYDDLEDMDYFPDPQDDEPSEGSIEEPEDEEPQA